MIHEATRITKAVPYFVLLPRRFQGAKQSAEKPIAAASSKSRSMKTLAANRTLKIAFLHPDLGIGGAERLVVDAALGYIDSAVSSILDLSSFTTTLFLQSPIAWSQCDNLH